jgi:hypothetical protein
MVNAVPLTVHPNALLRFLKKWAHSLSNDNIPRPMPAIFAGPNPKLPIWKEKTLS